MQHVMYIILLSILSVSVIFVLTKLMGCRQMSQMSMFDYVNGITIGSIAAELATSLEDDYIQPLTAMLVFAAADIFLSILTSKSVKIRRIIEGKPIILMNEGELYKKNLKKAKMDVNEFLEQCRINGYFDVSKLETVILEENGRVSILPKVSERPVTPQDLNLKPQQEHLVANVILDGKVMKENLKHTGNDEKWLRNQLKEQGANRVEDILLATCDSYNKVTVFLKENRKEEKDILM